MAWFRRRSSTPESASATAIATTRDDQEDVTIIDVADAPDLTPIPTVDALERTERALLMLASQASQLQTTVIRLEHRVDVISGVLLDRLDAASTTELADARLETAKVASEVGRLEINLAAKLDAIRDEVRTLAGDEDEAIDLRALRPTDTGWSTTPARSA